ncbi:hypothetical protein ES705_38926 [subsurface metagenome]
MAGRLIYEKRHRYAHMFGENAEIWNRFLSEFPDRFDTVDYDFRVGKGMKLNPEWDEAMKRDATALTQKRIDVLAWTGEKPTIIEVKVRVGLSALGQVMGYKILFMKDFPHLDAPDVLIVTASIGTDDFDVLRGLRIPVVVV